MWQRCVDKWHSSASRNIEFSVKSLAVLVNLIALNLIWFNANQNFFEFYHTLHHIDRSFGEIHLMTKITVMYFPGIFYWFALVLRMNALDWETEDPNIYLTSLRNVWMHFHIDIRSNGILHKVLHKIIPKGNNCITPQRLSKRFFFFRIHNNSSVNWNAITCKVGWFLCSYAIRTALELQPKSFVIISFSLLFSFLNIWFQLECWKLYVCMWHIWNVKRNHSSL